MTLKNVQQHREDVAFVQHELQSAAQKGLMVRRGKASGQLPHATRSQQGAATRLSTGRLNAIFAIDEDHVWAEPGVTMEELCAQTLRRGLAPAVVPEFRGITVGGAVMGGALESSSSRYGQFSDSCDAYELLLDDGTLVSVSPQAYPELFYGISGSYGTLGSLMAAKIRLEPAKPAVRVAYQVVDGLDNIARCFDEVAAQKSPPDYLDGIVLDERRAIMMAGYQVDRSPTQRRLNRWWHPWFIQHAMRKTTSGCQDDVFPFIDYLFRYDRGAYWMGQFCTSPYALMRYLLRWRLNSPSFPKEMKRPFSQAKSTFTPSWAFRMAFGWALSSASLYRVLHRLPEQALAASFHIQDFYIPTPNLSLFLKHLRENVQIYPLWLCPMRGTQSAQFLSPHYLKQPSRHPLPDFVNVGVYGIPRNGRDIPGLTRELEVLTHELGGRKMLYGLNGIAQNEFWKVYDKAKYDQLRAIAHASSVLPDLYSKTCS